MRFVTGYTTWEGRELYHPCATCGKQFESRNAMFLHERTMHQGQPRRVTIYACKFCGKRYRNDRSYKVHLAKLHGAKKEVKQVNFLKHSRPKKMPRGTHSEHREDRERSEHGEGP